MEALIYLLVRSLSATTRAVRRALRPGGEINYCRNAIFGLENCNKRNVSSQKVPFLILLFMMMAFIYVRALIQ